MEINRTGLFSKIKGDEYKAYNNDDDMDRNIAETKCATQFGGVLAKVNSAVDSATLRNILASYGDEKVWIGAQRDSGGNWYWHNDGSPITWTNWDSVPDGSEDCVYVMADSMDWINKNCDEEAPVVACMIVHESTTEQTTIQTTVQTTEQTTVQTTEMTTIPQPCDTPQLGKMTYALKIDKKTVNDLSNAIGGEFVARSKLECATKCFELTKCICRAFVFNKSDKKCTLLESKIPLSNFVVDANGLSYYELDNVK
ncbi:unnamed protein product [Owenia fusiformis]|uniref:Uncharacterized protein n=1 Tax=Owenia fusiformis TaxID=6347 RepID=A0A8J1UC49_OWEFU|nr:unnamed protein product [Owenia fusiformis]